MTKKTKLRPFLLCLLIFIIAGVPSAWGADPVPQPFNFEKTQARIKEISRQIKEGQISQQQLETAKQQAEQFTRAANT